MHHYVCRICRQPVYPLHPPMVFPSATCCDDAGAPVSMTMDDVLVLVDERELVSLWHLSRIGAAAASQYSRYIWIADTYSKQHPEHGSATAIYKALDRFGIGAMFAQPEHERLRARLAKGLRP